METARKRIIDFIEAQGIKPNIFLRKTGLKKGFIDRSHQGSGASDIYLSKILDVFPEINPEWLLTGKGHMIKQPVSDRGEILNLKEENSRLKDKIIHLLEENTRLKEEAAIKSNKHTTTRPAPGKLTS